MRKPGAPICDRLPDHEMVHVQLDGVRFRRGLGRRRAIELHAHYVVRRGRLICGKTLAKHLVHIEDIVAEDKQNGHLVIPSYRKPLEEANPLSRFSDLCSP